LEFYFKKEKYFGNPMSLKGNLKKIGKFTFMAINLPNCKYCNNKQKIVAWILELL